MIAELYSPCVTGLHVCQAADASEFVTVDNFPARSIQRARAAWRAVQHEFDDLPVDECDLVLDLMTGGDCVEDFHIRRQWLGRIRQIVEAQNA